MAYLPIPRGGASGLGASDMEASRGVAAAYGVTLPSSYVGCLSQQMHLIWNQKCKAWQSIQSIRGIGQAPSPVREVSVYTTVNGVRIRRTGKFSSGDWAGWSYCAMAALPVCGVPAAAPAPAALPTAPASAPTPAEPLPGEPAPLPATEATVLGVSRTGLLIAGAVLVGGIIIWKVVK